MSGQFSPGRFSPVAASFRRRTIVRRVVAVGVLVAVLVVVALLWPRPQRGGLDVSTASGTTTPAGVLQGPLAADREAGRACYSLTSRGTTAVLRFAEGWSADTRLGLRDPSGLVVAQPGDDVVLLGAPATVGRVPGCTARGRIWTVTSVRLPAQR